MFCWLEALLCVDSPLSLQSHEIFCHELLDQLFCYCDVGTFFISFEIRILRCDIKLAADENRLECSRALSARDMYVKKQAGRQAGLKRGAAKNSDEEKLKTNCEGQVQFAIDDWC
jgi:hypothetical protein